MQNTTADNLIDAQSGLKFIKCPRWTGQKLLFLDIHDRCIKSADLNGTVALVGTLPFVPGGLGVLADGDLIVGDAVHRVIYRWRTGDLKQIADLGNLAGFCLSEGIVDSSGGMYVGDVGFDFLDPLVDPVAHGVIVHIGADGKSSVVARDLFFPNGMVITPDNSTFIVAETFGNRLTAYQIEKDGSLKNRRVWAQLRDEVKPDGICLDREGAIWVAGTLPYALRVREGGEIDHRITAKQPVFATMLGGPDRTHLFMCTAASNDPVITRRISSATIDIAAVDIPGSGVPLLQDCNLRPA